MLFDFHQKQNTRKPKSVHATYLITGTRRVIKNANATNGRDGEDIAMQSSFMSSMPDTEEAEEEPVKKTTILLVREEELESTHIFSVSGYIY